MTIEKVNKKGLADHLRNFKTPQSIFVCPQRKIIRIKTPKTAGSSIGEQLTKQIKFIQNEYNPHKMEKWLDEITDKKLEEYFIFAFNP